MLEVGAGAGTITRKLADRYPSCRLVALEPAANMVEPLTAYAALSDRVTVHQETLADYIRRGDGNFDAVLYLNVLEHIEDDARELRLAAEVLARVAPCWCSGPHWSRSTATSTTRRGTTGDTSPQLCQLTEAAGLAVRKACYFDILGVPPYYLVYKLLRQTEISGSTMWGYDWVVVP